MFTRTFNSRYACRHSTQNILSSCFIPKNLKVQSRCYLCGVGMMLAVLLGTSEDRAKENVWL